MTEGQLLVTCSRLEESVGEATSKVVWHCSTTEAEYVPLSSVLQEAVWMRKLIAGAILTVVLKELQLFF